MATTTRTRKAAAKPAAAKTTAKPAAAKTNGRTAAKPAAKPAAKTDSKPAAQPEATDTEVPTGLAALAANAERAAKAQRTRTESAASTETRTCEGECEKTLPINKFPTTTRNKDGVMGRGKVCRACRDAKRAAKKAG